MKLKIFALNKIPERIADFLLLAALGFNWFFTSKYLNAHIRISDSISYHLCAVNFAKFLKLGVFLKDAYYPPLAPVGYSLILGLFYKIVAPSIILAKFLNLLFLTIAIVLLYLILKRFLGFFTAVISSIAMLALFNISIPNYELMSSALLYVFIFLSIYLYFCSNHRYAKIFSGFCAGYAFLIKPIAIFLGPAFILFEVVNYINTRNKKALGNLYKIIIGFLPMILLYFLLNKILYGSFLMNSYAYSQKIFFTANIITHHNIFPSFSSIGLSTGRYIYNIIQCVSLLSSLLLSKIGFIYPLYQSIKIYLIIAPVIGLIWFRKNSFIQFLAIMFIVNSVFVSFTRFYSQRYMLILAIILLIFGLKILQEVIKIAIRGNPQKIVLLILMLAIIYNINLPGIQHYYEYDQEPSYLQIAKKNYPQNAYFITPVSIPALHYLPQNVINLRSLSLKDILAVLENKNPLYLIYYKNFNTESPKWVDLEIRPLLQKAYKQEDIDLITVRNAPYCADWALVKYPQVFLLYDELFKKGDFVLEGSIGAMEIYKRREK